MNSDRSYRVNAPTVSHETIDGEAVIIDLETGSYYSLTRAGSAIWALLVAGHSTSGICNCICNSYEGTRTEIEKGIQDLLARLQDENLIVEAKSIAVSGDGMPATSERTQFDPPVLEKFTDMQELLLLDPVHDVDDMGWPRKPE